MNTKLVVLLGGVGAVHLVVAGLLLSGGCTSEDPPMPPGIYVPKQNPNQNPAPYQDIVTTPAVEPSSGPSQSPTMEPESAMPPAAPVESESAKSKVQSAPQQTKDRRYVVVKGDSLWKIAHKNGLKIEELASYNSLKADAKLRIGQVLYIPAAGTKGVKPKASAKKSAAGKASGGKGKTHGKRSARATKTVPADGIHVVKSGDNFTTIARQYGIKLSDVIHANPGVESNRLKIGQKIRLTESAAPVQVQQKAKAKKPAAKPAAKPAKQTAKPAAPAEPAGTDAAAPAPESEAQPQTKETSAEMKDLLKDENPPADQKTDGEEEADPKALVPDKDRTVITKDGDAEILINSDTTVVAFCRKFRVQEAEVRRMNPALTGTDRIKAGSRILLSGGEVF